MIIFGNFIGRNQLSVKECGWSPLLIVISEFYNPTLFGPCKWTGTKTLGSKVAGHHKAASRRLSIGKPKVSIGKQQYHCRSVSTLENKIVTMLVTGDIRGNLHM